MQYTFIRNTFSRSKRFEILDIYDQPAFRVSKVSGKIFTSNFDLLEEKTQQIIRIQQHFKGFRQHYSFEIEGQKRAELKRKFRFFKPYFLLECIDGSEYQIESDSWRKNYTFLKEEEIIATLQRKLVKWHRRYELTFLQMKHQELLLATVIAIDHMHEQDGSG